MAYENKPAAKQTAIVPVAAQPAVVATTGELETSIQGFSAPWRGS